MSNKRKGRDNISFKNRNKEKVKVLSILNEKDFERKLENRKNLEFNKANLKMALSQQQDIVRRQNVELIYMQKLLGLNTEDRIYLKEKAEKVMGKNFKLNDEALVDGDMDYVYPLLKSYDEKFREYDGAFESKKKTIEGLRIKTKHLVKENASLREELSKKIYERESDNDTKSTLMKIKLDTLEDEKASYEEELNHLYELLEEMMNKCKNYEKEMEVFKKYKVEFEEEEDYDSDKVMELQGMIRGLKSQLEDKADEIEELIVSKNDYELMINDLKVEKKKVEAKFKMIVEKKENQQNQIEEMNIFPTAHIKDLEDQINSLKNKEKDLKNKIVLEQEKTNQNRINNLELESEYALISKQGEEYKERIRILEEKITRLEFKNEDLQNKIRNNEKRMKEVVNKEAKYLVMDDESDKEKKMLINSHQRAINEIKDKYNKMLTSTEMIKDDEIKKLSEELEIIIRENDKLKLKVERNERMAKMAKKEKETYKIIADRIESKEREIIEIKTDLNRKDQKIIELQKKIEGQNIMKKINEAKSFSQPIAKVNNVEVSDLRKENRLLKEELDRLRARFERMNIEQEKIRKEEREFDSKEKNERMKNWEKKIIQLESDMLDKEKKYEKKIKTLVETLKEQEYLSQKIRNEFEKSISYYENKINGLQVQNKNLKAKFGKLSETIGDQKTRVI